MYTYYSQFSWVTFKSILIIVLLSALPVTDFHSNGQKKLFSKKTILLGLSGSVMRGDGKTKNELLLTEGFGTLFLIGLLTNLQHGDVTMESQNSFPCKPAD